MILHSRPTDDADRPSCPLGADIRTALAGIAASALIGVAACGCSAAGSAGHPTSPNAGHSKELAAAVRASAGVPLCAAAQEVDRVAVRLTSALPASDFHKLLPGEITIRDAPRARALAFALCALPPRPPGLHCPVDFAGAFRLVFAAGRRGFQPVRIQVSGCRGVTGVGPARSWSLSPPLGRLLSQLLGGKAPLLIPSKQPSSVPTP